MPPAPSPGWRDYRRALESADRRHRAEIHRIRVLHKLSPQPRRLPKGVAGWIFAAVITFALVLCFVAAS